MDEIFKNIDAEKRDRIINSALEEFSKNSFDKASTNNIVKKAGISKGLLYHYFKSKKSLYEYLEVFVVETMVKAILDELIWDETDLFIRIKQVVLIKFKVFVKYPSLIGFSRIMYEGKSVEETKESIDGYIPDFYTQIYMKNINFSLFKENVDLKKVIKITQWTMEKLGDEWITQVDLMHSEINYQALAEEIDGYLEVLREAFYK